MKLETWSIFRYWRWFIWILAEKWVQKFDKRCAQKCPLGLAAKVCQPTHEKFELTRAIKAKYAWSKSKFAQALWFRALWCLYIHICNSRSLRAIAGSIHKYIQAADFSMLPINPLSLRSQPARDVVRSFSMRESDLELTQPLVSITLYHGVCFEITKTNGFPFSCRTESQLHVNCERTRCTPRMFAVSCFAAL